jgi:hypothetical protein
MRRDWNMEEGAGEDEGRGGVDGEGRYKFQSVTVR